MARAEIPGFLQGAQVYARWKPLCEMQDVAVTKTVSNALLLEGTEREGNEGARSKGNKGQGQLHVGLLLGNKGLTRISLPGGYLQLHEKSSQRGLDHFAASASFLQVSVWNFQASIIFIH